MLFVTNFDLVFLFDDMSVAAIRPTQYPVLDSGAWFRNRRNGLGKLIVVNYLFFEIIRKPCKRSHLYHEDGTKDDGREKRRLHL